MKDLRNLTRIFSMLVASAGLTACDPGDRGDGGGNADASVDPNCPLWYLDTDGDHYGDAEDTGSRHCEDPDNGRVLTNTDCDDLKDWVNPSEEEVCDGVDNDCSNGLDEVCPAGCTPVTLTINSATGQQGDYLVCRQGQRWEIARNTCLLNGYDLVHINSAQENQTLRTFASGQQITNFLLGATDREEEEHWYWVGESPPVHFWTGRWAGAYSGATLFPILIPGLPGNGEAVANNYANWDETIEPNNFPTSDGLGEDVAFMQPSGVWTDTHINTAMPWVCERF